ncbi:hypothetical protein E3T49_01005 [Cryobacterium cryoconiti]|uniref:Uncharacterized protein n=1 Tax=Cryobacterium cryoconiti TaxID=1259239 RepID=A0A4Y8JYX8_9MICO|nr:hypothetical protein E3T49_01005 [Cryobacterium cryoconiti]
MRFDSPASAPESWSESESGSGSGSGSGSRSESGQWSSAMVHNSCNSSPGQETGPESRGSPATPVQIAGVMHTTGG